MTKYDLQIVLKVLSKIKEPDTKVLQAIAIVNKDIAMYDARKGQLIESYETESGPW